MSCLLLKLSLFLRLTSMKVSFIVFVVHLKIKWALGMLMRGDHFEWKCCYLFSSWIIRNYYKVYNLISILCERIINSQSFQFLIFNKIEGKLLSKKPLSFKERWNIDKIEKMFWNVKTNCRLFKSMYQKDVFLRNRWEILQINFCLMMNI